MYSHIYNIVRNRCGADRIDIFSTWDEFNERRAVRKITTGHYKFICILLHHKLNTRTRPNSLWANLILRIIIDGDTLSVPPPHDIYIWFIFINIARTFGFGRAHTRTHLWMLICWFNSATRRCDELRHHNTTCGFLLLFHIGGPVVPVPVPVPVPLVAALQYFERSSSWKCPTVMRLDNVLRSLCPFCASPPIAGMSNSPVYLVFSACLFQLLASRTFPFGWVLFIHTELNGADHKQRYISI